MSGNAIRHVRVRRHGLLRRSRGAAVQPRHGGALPAGGDRGDLSGMAKASWALGLLALFLWWMPCVGGAVTIAAIVVARLERPDLPRRVEPRGRHAGPHGQRRRHRGRAPPDADVRRHARRSDRRRSGDRTSVILLLASLDAGAQAPAPTSGPLVPLAYPPGTLAGNEARFYALSLHVPFAPGPEHRPALHWEGEEGTTRSLTYAELLREVNRAAGGLRALGVKPGDRVALFMPMCPELVVAFFAAIKIGGIVLPLFSGYGADAVTTRLHDAGVKVLITADGFWRRGQPVRMKDGGRRGSRCGAVRRTRGRRATARHRCLDGTTRFAVERSAGESPRHLRDRTHRRRRSADDHLHVGNDGPAQGRRAHALRLPDQDRAGHGALLRRPRRRDDVLGQRHGLDDGPVGSARDDAARRHRSCSTTARSTIPRPIDCGRSSNGIASTSSASRQH